MKNVIKIVKPIYGDLESYLWVAESPVQDFLGRGFSFLVSLTREDGTTQFFPAYSSGEIFEGIPLFEGDSMTQALEGAELRWQGVLDQGRFQQEAVRHQEEL